jgi:hypothetical protein
MNDKIADEDLAKKLTLDEAMALIVEGAYIHSIRQAGFAMIGADWKRKEVVEHIKKHGAELAGKGATRMGHGVAVVDDNGPVFFQTRPPVTADAKAE